MQQLADHELAGLEEKSICAERDAARRVLMVHRPDADGLCAGCLDNRAVFAWFPCEQARWAQKVTAGSGEGEWS